MLAIGDAGCGKTTFLNHFIELMNPKEFFKNNIKKHKDIKKTSCCDIHLL